MKSKISKYDRETPFVFDGAFGTYYYKKCRRSVQCESANLDDQETVYQIHREYVDAGVSAIKTNTFGANFICFPDVTLRDSIIKNGYELARMAVKDLDIPVFADIGYMDPDLVAEQQNASCRETTEQDAAEAVEAVKREYCSIAQKFLDLGAVNFIFETLADFENILDAVDLIKKRCSDAFIAVSFAVSEDGYSRKGLSYKTLLKQAMDHPMIDLCGLNCICGPSHLYQLLREIDVTRKPLCAMPNSGYPATINGRTVFQDNVRYFAGKLQELCNLGIFFLGGCCGTTPEHMKAAIDLLSIPSRVSSGEKNAARQVELIPVRANLFRDKINAGKPVIAVEIDPPADADCTYLISAARKAKAAGADIITIADSPLARTRADSILLAAKVKREVGIDVLPHLSCRDRNHIGIKSVLLGASIENISNILVVTGDPVLQTDRNEMKGVFSYNSYQLISFIKSMNEEIFKHAPMQIGAALNVNSVMFRNELKRASKKIEKGAEIFLTQPVFSEESIENAILAKKELPTRILFGIMPVASYRNAQFLNNEVSGIQIPQEFVDKLEGKTPEEVFELSLEFSMEIVKKTIGIADGYYLMIPLKKIDLVCELIRRIQQLQKERGAEI